MVPDLVDHFAQTLIRADLLEVAMPLIDSYARGVTHPVDEVVAEIDRRLQEIVGREPKDRHEHLESLAARRGLRGEVHETQEQQAQAATELGVSVQDNRDAQ